MNEPVLKQRQSHALDEFERRARHATDDPSGRRSDDPLAELARLVGEPRDPFDAMFAAENSAGPGAVAPGHPTYPGAVAPDYPTYPGAAPGHSPHPDAAAQPGYATEVPRLFGDFAAIEAGLRDGAPAGAPRYDAHHLAAGYEAQDAYLSGAAESGYVQAGRLPLDGDGEWTGVAPGEAGFGYDGHAAGNVAPAGVGDRARNRRPMMLMAASIAVGVLGIGAAFALKGRVSSSPREIKTIMADTSPTKIQPPPEVATDGRGDSSFGKGNAVQPTKLVSREEQPVDLGQAVQDNVARAAQAAASTDASSVPVPPAPGQMPGRADPIGAQMQGFAMTEMPAPKRVKVMRLKADDTVAPGDEAAASPQAQPARRDVAGIDRGAAATPAAKAGSPKDPAARAGTGKTTSRVAAAPAEEKTIEQIAADDAAPKPARRVKPQRVAAAEPGDAPAQARAEAPADAAAAADGGNFAVQLAAPTNEADAKAASTRFSKKFGDTLSGRRIAIRKAESNGRSVYRVRVSSLSRAEATSLCDKLKADGGSCYVAKN